MDYRSDMQRMCVDNNLRCERTRAVFFEMLFFVSQNDRVVVLEVNAVDGQTSLRNTVRFVTVLRRLYLIL